MSLSMQVTFDVKLDLDFNLWESKKEGVRQGLATKLQVLLSQVQIVMHPYNAYCIHIVCILDNMSMDSNPFP